MQRQRRASSANSNSLRSARNFARIRENKLFTKTGAHLARASLL